MLPRAKGGVGGARQRLSRRSSSSESGTKASKGSCSTRETSNISKLSPSCATHTCPRATETVDRSYLEWLSVSRDQLDSLLDSTSSTLNLLSSLSKSFRAVDAQTTAFRAQCHELLSEQRRLSTLSNDLETNVQYYNYLEPITRRLNAPGAGQFVRGKEFSEMLSNLDRCTEYMRAHVSGDGSRRGLVGILEADTLPRRTIASRTPTSLGIVSS